MNQLPESTGYSIWLLPDEMSSTLIQSAIRSLSEIFSSVSFLPHITLTGIPEGPSFSILKGFIKDLSESVKTFSVHTNEVICGRAPYQRFKLEVEDNLNLFKLSAECDKKFKGDYSKYGDFHFSLFYGFNRCEEIRDRFEKIDVNLPSKLYVQKIAVVKLDGPPEKWEMIYSRNLPR